MSDRFHDVFLPAQTVKMLKLESVPDNRQIVACVLRGIVSDRPEDVMEALGIISQNAKTAQDKQYGTWFGTALNVRERCDLVNRYQAKLMAGMGGPGSKEFIYSEKLEMDGDFRKFWKQLAEGQVIFAFDEVWHPCFVEGGVFRPKSASVLVGFDGLERKDGR